MTEVPNLDHLNLEAARARATPAFAPATNELGQPVGLAFDSTGPLAPPVAATLVGHYCTVTPMVVADHSAELFAAYSAADDDADWTYLSHGPFANHHDFEAWLATVEGLVDPMYFVIVDHKTGTAAGHASYMRLDSHAAVIEVGSIHLAPELQRTPAATEAMYLMAKHAFNGGYRRYEWKCDDLNGPSIAAAHRLGFRYEGTFRQATHYKGRSRDTAWFAILDSEWPALATAFEAWLDPTNFDAAGVQIEPLRARRS